MAQPAIPESRQRGTHHAQEPAAARAVKPLHGLAGKLMFEILPKRVFARKLVQAPPERPRMPPRESRR